MDNPPGCGENQVNPLRLSLADWCFRPPEAAAEAWFRQVRAMGYDGVELVPAERRQAALDAGLEIVSLAGPGMADGFSRRANRAKLTDELKRLAGEASACGAPYLVVFSGNRGGMSREEGFENCREAFSRLLPELRGSGVKLLFEMLNSFDHKDYLADREAFGFELADALDDPDFLLLYDVYHMAKAGDDPYDSVPRHIDRIGHFHIAALEKRGFPAEGAAIDYRRLLLPVRETYTGFFGMEFLSGNPAEDAAKAEKLFRSYAGTETVKELRHSC